MLSVAASLLISLTLADWDYDNQAAWTATSCSSSFKTQSPIDITNYKTSCPSSNKLDWTLEDFNKFEIENEESHYNIKVKFATDDGEGSNDAYGKLKNNFKDEYNSEHGDYCLDSVHFHWKSEHQIDGKQYDLEAHFVHYSCEYDSLSKALAASPRDKYVLAVVGVLYKEGNSNKFIKKITDSITSLKSPGKSIHVHEGINIKDLVPDFSDKSQYYHYLGSLTTPDCNPIVSWHVLKDPMTVSREELAKLATIENSKGNPITANFRDIQSNTNDIYVCGEGSNDD